MLSWYLKNVLLESLCTVHLCNYIVKNQGNSYETIQVEFDLYLPLIFGSYETDEVNDPCQYADVKNNFVHTVS